MKNFFEIISSHVLKNPSSPALKFGENTISYKDFLEMTANASSRVSQTLIDLNKTETIFIPIIFERSHWIPLIVQSLMFINKAYVPLDPDAPDERLKFLLKDINSPIVITTSKFKSKIDGLNLGIEVLDIEDLILPKGAPLISKVISPKDPCYMIYTSGTTGNPKGVVNIREGLMNRIEWMAAHYKLNSDSVFILKTPYTFDVSVWELTLPFLVGGTLVVAGPKAHLKINEIFRLIDTHQVTDIHFVPSVFHLFLNFIENRNLSSLTHIYCSGEGLSTELTNMYFQSSLKAELHNLYGPTECSIDVSYWQCSSSDSEKYSITPIGLPIWKTYFYVVDEKLNLVPEGDRGELLIGGIGVAQGYFNLEQLTAEKFIDDPVDPTKGKVYRTGDLVRMDSTGNYEFFGRIDFQVKINGQRVELGEIENTIMRMNGIKRVAVLYENKILVGFVEKVNEINDEDIINYLKCHLSSYMVPSRIISLENIPLNSSGKTDRKALKILL